VTLNLDFKVIGLSYLPLDLLCAQLTCDLFAIAKFLYFIKAVCLRLNINLNIHKSRFCCILRFKFDLDTYVLILKSDCTPVREVNAVLYVISNAQYVEEV